MKRSRFYWTGWELSVGWTNRRGASLLHLKGRNMHPKCLQMQKRSLCWQNGPDNVSLLKGFKFRIKMSCKNVDAIVFPHFLGGCFFNTTTGQQPELIPGQGQQVLLVSGIMTENVWSSWVKGTFYFLLNLFMTCNANINTKIQTHMQHPKLSTKIYIKMQAEWVFWLRISFISFQLQFRLHIISRLMLPTLPWHLLLSKHAMIIFRKKRQKLLFFSMESNTIENWDLILKLALWTQVETQQGCASRPCYQNLATRCEQTVNKPRQPYLLLTLITGKGEKMTNVLMRMIIKQTCSPWQGG